MGVNRRVRVLLVVVGICAILAGGGVAVKRKQRVLASAPKYGVEPLPVRVASVRGGTLELTRDYLAVVEPFRTATLAARVTARVESVEVDEGAAVHAGDVLVRLDSTEIRLAVADVKAQIEQAAAEWEGNAATVSALEKSLAYWRTEADRLKRLLEHGQSNPTEVGAAQDKVDLLTGELQAARAKSESLRWQIEALQHRLGEEETRLSYCVIESPYDGVVAERLVDPGDLAVPGKPLLVVHDRQQLKLSFDVLQADLPEVQTGLTVRFGIAQSRRQVPLTHLFPALNEARMQRAEVWLSPELGTDLVCGAYVPVTVVLRRLDDVALVPATAIVESPDGRPHVFAVVAQRLRLVPVTVLGQSGEDVAVEGVAVGQEVVLNTFLGWAQLAPEQPVEVLP